VGKLLVVFDLDGTLINVESVVHLAQAKEWDEFHEATLRCPPYQQMVDYARFIQRLTQIDWIVATAKPEKFRHRTVNWLSVHGLMPEALLMRSDHDYRPSPELKLDMVRSYVGGEENWKSSILFAVEDRDKMVDAWRGAGVPCLQCAPSLY
jgi:FMN phosphatase YigB (HAD superfamily)